MRRRVLLLGWRGSFSLTAGRATHEVGHAAPRVMMRGRPGREPWAYGT